MVPGAGLGLLFVLIFLVGPTKVSNNDDGLLRSWIAEVGLAGRAAWVAAGREERDPQRFWLSVAGALRATGPGAGLADAPQPGTGSGRGKGRIFVDAGQVAAAARSER